MKNLLWCLIFTISPIVVTAQESEKRVGFGFQVGWSSSHISGKTFDSKNGFIGGVHAAIPIHGNFYIQPEVNYQQLGGKYKTHSYVIGDLAFRYVELHASYLHVPLLVKYRILTNNLSVYTGPQIGFRLKAKDKLDDGNSYDLKNVKSKDFSGVFGLEYFVRLPEEQHVALVLNARYMAGFTNFANYRYANMPEKSYRNNALMVTLGLRF